MTKSDIPAISVITVTHNSARWIRGCLQALVSQSCRLAYELVVVDNGSRDETVDIVRREFPNVTLVQSKNVGFGAGNNLGAHHARGKYLAFANPDTIAQPDWLQALVDPLVERDLVTTSKIVLMTDPTKINTCGHTNHFTGFGFVEKFGEPSSSAVGAWRTNGVSGAAFAVRRATFDKLAGFDEDFFLYMEDSELSWRLRASGIPIFCVGESIIQHSYALSFSPNKIYYLEFGRTLILRKHYSLRNWLLLSPSLVVAELMALALSARFGWSGVRAKFHATRDAIRTRLSSPRFDKKWVDLDAWRVPFAMISHGRWTRTVGAIANVIFWLNTAPLRASRSAFQRWR